MLAREDLESLPPLALKVCRGEVPKPAQMMAAKGILPGLRPEHVVTVLVALESAADPEVKATAVHTLDHLAVPILEGALGADLPEPVIQRLALSHVNDHAVLEKILRLPRIGEHTLTQLATRADEKAGELIATNEELMLKFPVAIEKLYMNKHVRMSTADRLLELAVRNGIELSIPAFKEAALAIKNELIQEPSEEPTPDDELFREVTELGEQADLSASEDTHEIDEEGEEHVRQKYVPLYARVALLSVTQKIRLAMVGTSAERMLLIRDSKRLVAEAAAKSPLIREDDAIRATASRAVYDSVLRIIANNRDLTRSYQVKLNLVTNPHTPFAFASRMVTHLRDADLRSISKSKNVSGSIVQAVRHQLNKKSGRS